MQKEYNDILAMIEMVNESGLDLRRNPIMIEEKKEKVEKYLIYSYECGTLTDAMLTHKGIEE